MDIVRLKEKLGAIEDPRRQWGNLRHKLIDILVIGLTTLLCNGADFEDMEDFGREREDELKKFLELPGGIPDESTFFRVFQRIKPAQLSACIRMACRGVGTARAKHQYRRENDTEEQERRRERRACVSAWAGETHIDLGQLAVDEKSNEIPAIPKLLDLVAVTGAPVTIDASDYSPRGARPQ